MKLQIIRKEQQSIEGFELITIDEPNKLDLSHIINNSCELILAPDLVDSFHQSTIDQLCESLVLKTRLNGEIVLGGTDIRFFAKNIYNGTLSYKDACGIVCNIYSMSTSDMIIEAFRKLNVNLVSVIMDGLHYEVKGVRK